MKIVTGNRLEDGAVVYLGCEDRWVPHLSAAARFGDDDAKSILASAQSRTKEIADTYLVDVDDDGALVGRETLRETIRKSGPTVRTDIGYQAGTLA